jgi:hypothetical protein
LRPLQNLFLVPFPVGATLFSSKFSFISKHFLYLAFPPLSRTVTIIRQLHRAASIVPSSSSFFSFLLIPSHLSSNLILILCPTLIFIIFSIFSSPILLLSTSPSLSPTYLQIRFYKRFYSSIILYKLTEETPLMRVGAMMSITSGQMQQLQKEAVRM